MSEDLYRFKYMKYKNKYLNLLAGADDLDDGEWGMRHGQPHASSYDCRLGKKGVKNQLITTDNCNTQISDDMRKRGVNTSRCKLDKNNKCRKAQSNSTKRGVKNMARLKPKLFEKLPGTTRTHRMAASAFSDRRHGVTHDITHDPSI